MNITVNIMNFNNINRKWQSYIVELLPSKSETGCGHIYIVWILRKKKKKNSVRASNVTGGHRKLKI